MNIVEKVSQKTWINSSVIENIIKLLEEWNTIPFIARYRKELTKWATDEQLRDFNDIYEYSKNLKDRKDSVLKLIDEKWLLSEEIKKSIEKAETLAEVEDIYRPFKEKKNTRATLAKWKWLEPFAEILRSWELSKEEIQEKALDFIVEDKDPKKSVKDAMDAIFWAKDIIAEEVSDNAFLRKSIKEKESILWNLVTKKTKNFDEDWVYKLYKEYKKTISKIPSHSYLAICRAENEKQISVKLEMYEEAIFSRAKWIFVPKNANTSKIYIEEAVEDGLNRLLLPSVEREIRSEKKKEADLEAIRVFWENMKNLLLTPPIKWKTIISFDPWFRTWCKVAVVWETWNFLENTTIFPVPPRMDIIWAEKKVYELIKKYDVNLAVIWNWTASRETEKFFTDFLKKNSLSLEYAIVSEAWASVYSASKLATEEYPDLDVTVRWAISIAHRVQDSMAELTKIDPKSIWVWQYQHDVDQKLLKFKLDEKVEDCVNNVGVDLNTASYTLLSHISWLSLKIAQEVVKFREEIGSFSIKSQLKKVKWLWPKAFEQSVWFLRIKSWKELLDATWIHPETYKITYEILEKELQIDKKNLSLPLSLDIENIDIDKISSNYDLWKETILDIFRELNRPWLDPRDELDLPKFKSDIVDFKNLKEGMILSWVVRNVTNFGAFVDIWLHNDGLVHISQMSKWFVSNPSEIASVGDNIEVKVLEIDVQKEKVSLSMVLD